MLAASIFEVHALLSPSKSVPSTLQLWRNGPCRVKDQCQRDCYCVFRKSFPATLFASDDFNFENEIDIDAVLLEAETALQAAEATLASPTKEEASSPLYQLVIDAVASATGGILVGALLGFSIYVSIPDLDMLVSSLVLPVLMAFILGTIGFASGFATTSTGSLIRKAFGDPIKALLVSLGLVAKRQVEKSAIKVKSIPRKVASQVAQKAEDTAEEITQVPSRLATAAKERVSLVAGELNESFQEFVNVITSKESLILIALTSVTAIGFLLLDPTVLTNIGGGGGGNM